MTSRQFEIVVEPEPGYPMRDVGPRVHAVAEAWARRGLPFDWLVRGLHAVPGVAEVVVLEQPSPSRGVGKLAGTPRIT